jgi:hypothetical protein
MTIDPETLKTIVAVWGAVTGTVALSVNLYQHISNRPKLKLSAGLGTVYEPNKPTHFSLDVTAVNVGRRVFYIRRVALELPPADQVTNGVKMVSRRLNIYNGDSIALAPDGGRKEFNQAVPQEIVQRLPDNAVVLVTDSLGKIHRTKFVVPSNRTLPQG